MKELDEPIHLCSYDEQWPKLYTLEAQRMAEELPADVVIEHIGSTAVPGLLAKPIIDMMIGMEPHHNHQRVRSVLVTIGYEDMGEAGVPGRVYFRRRATAAFNAALVVHGGSLWVANLALRDFLRENPDAAREYADSKRSALESGIRTLLAYSEYKSAVVTGLIRRALGTGVPYESDEK